MKVKVLRYKKEFNDFQEFVLIEEYGGEPTVFTSETPKLYSESATLEGLMEYIETNDYYEGLDLDWDKVELVEYDLIESGEVGADIRNKLSPCKTLASLVEVFLNEEHPDKKNGIKELIWDVLEQNKKSVEYLANLL